MLTIDEVERELAALAVSIDAEMETVGQPAAMVDEVLHRLEHDPVSASADRGRRWLIGAAAAVVLVGSTLAVPQARRAVGRWLGFDSVRIEPTPSSGLGLPQATFPAALDLPVPVGARQAADESGLPVPDAPGLGQGTIFVVHPPQSGQVLVVYPPSVDVPETPINGVGALLATLPGRIRDGLFNKLIGPGTEVDALQLATASGRRVPAYWVGGTPHTLLFESSSGVVDELTLRLSSNTLLWQVDGVVYRLESVLTKAQAVRIAGTVVAAAGST